MNPGGVCTVNVKKPILRKGQYLSGTVVVVPVSLTLRKVVERLAPALDGKEAAD